MPRIKTIDFFRAVSPLSRPLADSTHQLKAISFIVLRLETESGLIGESYLLSFDYSPGAIAGALKDLRDFALGWDISEIGKFVAAYRAETEYFGVAGIHSWSLALADLAMWDAWAKHLGRPVWKLIGAQRDRVPVYGSGGWLSYSIQELLEEATGYVRRGFGAVKVKVGSPEMACDVERLTRVREAVGPRVGIMMDANQGMNGVSARELVRAVEHLNIRWFEEPLPNTDWEGYAALREVSRMTLAMGEREYGTESLRELIRRRALDLWQPDIIRLGGVEGWRASAALAHAHGIPVLPHFYKEYDVPLLMTIPNPYGSEWFDWVDGLLDQPMTLDGGCARPNDRPGWGFSFRSDRLEPLLS